MLERRRVSDRAIHAVRKELKRTRALLRMMRDALSESAYRESNAALRDIAHQLGALRDSKVLVETLEGLPRRGQSAATVRSVADLRTRLKLEHARARDLLRSDRSATKHACTSLRNVRRRLGQGRADRYDWSVLESGVQRIYGRARVTLGRAQARCRAQDLHELRKQTKYLWHQLEALKSWRPRSIGSVAEQTHRLSDLLGDDHNLAVLRDVVRHASLDRPVREALLRLIDAKRESLTGRALTLGRRIYCDSPAAFTARIGCGAAGR